MHYASHLLACITFYFYCSASFSRPFVARVCVSLCLPIASDSHSISFAIEGLLVTECLRPKLRRRLMYRSIRNGAIKSVTFFYQLQSRGFETANPYFHDRHFLIISFALPLFPCNILAGIPSSAPLPPACLSHSDGVDKLFGMRDRSRWIDSLDMPDCQQKLNGISTIPL